MRNYFGRRSIDTRLYLLRASSQKVKENDSSLRLEKDSLGL